MAVIWLCVITTAVSLVYGNKNYRYVYKQQPGMTKSLHKGLSY